EAAAAYYEALKQGQTKEDMEKLEERLTQLEAEYSDNPAYLALIRQKYTVRKWEVEHYETSK
ncbi:MAG: ATP-binding protein, partial [Clostridiaceae bacterium]|nr:ATP-binding protein [Clostridiaceae bacterium]